ncbi:MAG TPA: hypothetical protein VJ650_14525 [Gemmatimonadaceae bacterium]|nr:hypothetical protein [Gemmatimonadaceae bacterium]
MVSDLSRDGETVFDVFAGRARGRSRVSLLEQGVACAVGGLAIFLLASAWWPLAAGLGAGASYAAWGLLERRPPSSEQRIGLRALATIATVLALLAIIGTGLAAFTGDGRSPYGTCYDANGRAFACDARGQRRP